MSHRCCPSRNDTGKHGLLLPKKDKVASATHHSKRKDQWDALKKYIEKYTPFRPRLPVIVAETLLCANKLFNFLFGSLRCLRPYRIPQAWAGLNQTLHHCSNFM